MTTKHKVVFGEMDYLKHALIMLGSEARLFELFDYSSADLMQLSDTLRSKVRGRDYGELQDRIERLENPGEEDDDQEDHESPASGKAEAAPATVAEEEPTTAQPTERASASEPHLEVARILRERVNNRLYLITDIAKPEGSGNYDRELDAVAVDTINLIRALATYLESGEMPEHKSQLKDPDLSRRILERIRGGDLEVDSTQLIAKELSEVWDSQPPTDEPGS